MIALFRDIRPDEPRGVLRTALADDGSAKRIMLEGVSSKLMLGSSKHAAIKLHPLAKTMGIAEGIETALSASELFGLPVWAVMSAGGLGQFPILRGVEHLSIFADNDAPGLAAARRCATRYGAARISGEIRHPSRPGSDWNFEIEEIKK